MKNIMKRMLALMLILCTITSMMVPIPAFAAEPFSTIEVFGSKDRCYITIKENAPLRASPSDKGTILERLSENYPLEAEGLFRTKKGTLWLKVKSEYDEAWIYTGNVTLHSCSFLNLDDYNIKFCSICGHIVPLTANNQVDMEVLHICLAAASFIPVIGNGFDMLDALISLAEGEYDDALMAMGAAVPIVGSIPDMLQLANASVDVMKTSRVVVTATRVADNVVEIAQKPDYYALKKDMQKRLDETGDMRWLKVDGDEAHHIVPAGDSDPNAEEARNILAYLGIDVNSADNGVYLCGSAADCWSSTIHGRHGKNYTEAVNQRLKKVFNDNRNRGISAQREAIIHELDEIAWELMEGSLKLK